MLQNTKQYKRSKYHTLKELEKGTAQLQVLHIVTEAVKHEKIQEIKIPHSKGVSQAIANTKII